MAPIATDESLAFYLVSLRADAAMLRAGSRRLRSRAVAARATSRDVRADSQRRVEAMMAAGVSTTGPLALEVEQR